MFAVSLPYATPDEAEVPRLPMVVSLPLEEETDAAKSELRMELFERTGLLVRLANRWETSNGLACYLVRVRS